MHIGELRIRQQPGVVEPLGSGELPLSDLVALGPVERGGQQFQVRQLVADLPGLG